jgi:CheY-like chemotaxis protein
VKTIAVVDDNPVNRRLLRAILKKHYEIVEYGTGMEALQGLADGGSALVLLDISLPDVDGTEVLRRIRANPDLQKLPVIAVTAHALHGDRERFMAAGFDGYLSKPIVDVNEVVELVGRHLAVPTPPPHGL